MTHTERNVDMLHRVKTIIKKVNDGECELEEAERDIESMILIDISMALASIADALEKRDKMENQKKIRKLTNS